MHMRYMRRQAVLMLAGAMLLGLAGCGEDKYVATTTLSGANEVGPVDTPASGTATATLEDEQLTVTGTFRDLGSDLMEVSDSSAHIHNAPAGENGPILFNLDVTSSDQRNGNFSGKANLNKEQQQAFKDGNLYVNIHTVNYMGGEIRGQFRPSKED